MKKISALSSDVHCRACDGSGIFIPLEFLELERDIAAILASFPPADIMGKGQWFFSPRTIVRTLAYMYHKGDIEGRNIACLAAPTLAVGLATLERNADLDISISVLDIDLDVLDVISRNFDFVDVREYNLSNTCPHDLRGQYDCFLFDPLYSVDHYRVGLSRCVQLVGEHQPDRFGYIVVPPEEIAPVRVPRNGRRVPLQLSVFQLLNEMGLCIADFKDGFIDYETPLAEEGLLRYRAKGIIGRESVGVWRSSDLVRVITTATTSPVVVESIELQKRVNTRRRVGASHVFVQLDNTSSENTICNMCMSCFSSHEEDQRFPFYTRYWQPAIHVRPMPSWRDENDQPFAVGAACVGFENTSTGELVILRGPAAKAIWETLRDLEEELEDTVQIRDILNRSLTDYADIDSVTLEHDGISFVKELMDIGLILPRRVI